MLLAGVGAGRVSAAELDGFRALALAAIVGGHSPAVGAADRAGLAGLLDGRAVAGRRITITADAISCRAGDVDIAAFGCDLSFAAGRRSLSGRAAHELFATLVEAGVPPDGAAGTVHAALHALACTLDPTAIAGKDGSGATCRYDPGPP